MRNFSSDPNKPSFMSEAPGFVKFFLDPSKPKAIKIGAIAVLLFIFFLPLISAGKSKNKREDLPAAQKKILEEANRAPEPPTAPPEAKAMLSSETKSEASIFTAIPGPYPVLVSITDDQKGSVWATSIQDVFEIKEEKATKKLDPDSYESMFNDELHPITASFTEPSGEIWTGSKDGQVMRYANYDWKIIFERNKPISDRIFAIGKQGPNVFLGTASGMLKWNPETGKLSRFGGFQGQQISAFSRSPSGALHALSSRGVWKLTEKGWEQILKLHESVRANSLAFLNEQTLFLGTLDGVIRYDTNSAHKSRHLLGTEVASLEAATYGVWIGLQNDGIRFFDGRRWYALHEENGLPANVIAQLHLDQSGDLWLGVNGKGLYRARAADVRRAISAHPIEDIAPNDDAPRLYKNACKAAETELKRTNSSGDITAVSIRSQSTVFFRGAQVCPSGIGYRRDNGAIVIIRGKELLVGIDDKTTRIVIPDKYPAVEFRKLFLDSLGRIWIARSKGGLMYGNGKWFDASDDPMLAGNAVQAFGEDSNQILWMGTAPAFDEQNRVYTQPSLHAFNGQGWLHRSYEQNVPGYSVTALLPLRKGGMLVGTPSSFAVATPEKINFITGKTALPAPVSAVTEDLEGALWVAHAFFQKGLSVYAEDQLYHFETPGKLFSNNFADVAKDSSGNIWLMSTSGEIGVYPREKLMQIISQSESE